MSSELNGQLLPAVPSKKQAEKANAALCKKYQKLKAEYLGSFELEVMRILRLAVAEEGTSALGHSAKQLLQRITGFGAFDGCINGPVSKVKALAEAFATTSRELEQLKEFMADNFQPGQLLRNADINSLQWKTKQNCRTEACSADDDEELQHRLDNSEAWQALSVTQQPCRLFVRHKIKDSAQTHRQLQDDAFPFLIDNGKMPTWRPVQQVAFVFKGQDTQEQLKKIFGSYKCEVSAALQIKWKIAGRHPSPTQHATTDLRISVTLDNQRHVTCKVSPGKRCRWAERSSNSSQPYSEYCSAYAACLALRPAANASSMLCGLDRKLEPTHEYSLVVT